MPHVAAWYVIADSTELQRAPVAVTLNEVPLVVFRGKDGAATTFSDRCPHRNVPLSMGVVREGTLECAYHGWRFDNAGACVAVPGLVDGEISLRSRCAEVWPTVEVDGFVWVYGTPGPMPASQPFRFPHLNDAGYTTVRKRFEVEASVHAVAENALDVPHTGFLHGGLFRTAEKKNTIDVVIRRHPTYAEAEFIGEPRPSGLIGRVLSPGGGVVQHFDRFLLPSITQVDYRLGDASHLVSTSALTPVSPTRTVVNAVVTFRLPVPSWLAKPFIMPIAERIFKQDAVVLTRQSQRIAQFGGEKYTSTELDVLGAHIARLLKHAASGEPQPKAVSELRIRMRT